MESFFLPAFRLWFLTNQHCWTTLDPPQRTDESLYKDSFRAEDIRGFHRKPHQRGTFAPLPIPRTHFVTQNGSGEGKTAGLQVIASKSFLCPWQEYILDFHASLCLTSAMGVYMEVDAGSVLRFGLNDGFWIVFVLLQLIVSSRNPCL